MAETTAGWAKEVYDLYAEGASDTEVAAHLKLTLRQFYQQLDENDKFRILVDFGRTMSQAWWERQGRKNLQNKQFNSVLWFAQMKNKFGWADKVESSSTNENLNTNIDDLKEKIQKEMLKFVKRHNPELTDAKLVIEGLNAQSE